GSDAPSRIEADTEACGREEREQRSSAAVVVLLLPLGANDPSEDDANDHDGEGETGATADGLARGSRDQRRPSPLGGRDPRDDPDPLDPKGRVDDQQPDNVARCREDEAYAGAC